MRRTHKAPLWYWIVSALALGWNLLGVATYIEQANMSPDALQALPDAERALLAATPAWATAAFAAAVFGGAAGCLLLLLRSRLALPALILSLLGVLTQMGYSLFLSKAFEVYGPGGVAMPILVVVVAMLLVAFARHAARRRWLA